MSCVLGRSPMTSCRPNSSGELIVGRVELRRLWMRGEINQEGQNNTNTGSEQSWWILLLPVAACLGVGVIIFVLSYLF